jgi:KDO2-lipid IV(A) lauroyltransferase
MLTVPSLFQTGLSRLFQSPINTFLASSMPLRLFRAYCYVLGVCYFSVRKDHRRQVTAGILNHLGGKKLTVNDLQLLWKTYQGILEHYMEKMINVYHPPNHLIHYLNSHIEIRNEAWLTDALQQKKGVLMVTGHFGAVEYLPMVLALKGFRSAMIMRFKTERLRKDSQLRSKLFNFCDIDADKPNTAFRAMEAVRQGRVLITLCDEFSHWKPNRERVISVFGNPVCQDKTLDLLYKRCKPPTCMGLLLRHRKGYVLHIDPIANGDPSISLAERAWRKMEHTIYQHPEQWYQWQQVADRLAAYRLMEK